MYRCSKMVVRRDNGVGYKVYKSESAAKAAGAKVCGGMIRAALNYEDHWASSDGMSGRGSYISSINGIELRCSKCCSRDKMYDMDDLVNLVEQVNS